MYEWCDRTVNPVTGCLRHCPWCISRYCCEKFKSHVNMDTPAFHEDRLAQIQQGSNQIILLTSMSDPADWETDWLSKTLKAAGDTPKHKFVMLSRDFRAFREKMQFFSRPPNLMTGATIVSRDELERVKPYHPEIFCFMPILEQMGLWQESRYTVHAKWIIAGADARQGERIIPKLSWIMDVAGMASKLSIPIWQDDTLSPYLGKKNLRQELPKGWFVNGGKK